MFILKTCRKCNISLGLSNWPKFLQNDHKNICIICYRKYQRQRRQSNPQHFRDLNRNWINNNRERYMKQHRAYEKLWKKNHIDHVRRKSREWNKKSRNKNRSIVLKHYSPNLICQRCGCNNIHLLSIDHMNGDGAQSRKKLKTSYMIYRHIIKDNFPLNFQVLCWNCQWIKRHENKEWGKTSLKTPYKVRLRVKHYQNLLKDKVITHYSPKKKCILCGFSDIRALSIDHIKGGGNKHKTSLGITGAAFYRWIINQRYPNMFRVLCMNCNRLEFLNSKIVGVKT